MGKGVKEKEGRMSAEGKGGQSVEVKENVCIWEGCKRERNEKKIDIFKYYVKKKSR